MNRITLIIPLAFLLTGCAFLNLSQTKPDGSKVTFRASSLFSNSVLKGVGVDTMTKTTSSALRISSTGTEPNPESITATGTALGDLIGTAAAAAAKGVAKP